MPNLTLKNLKKQKKKKKKKNCMFVYMLVTMFIYNSWAKCANNPWTLR